MIVTHRSASAGSAQAVCLPAAVRRRGTLLLNQQFWLWGQDIRYQEGNILLRYGFTRRRPPGEIQGGRCYTLRLDADRIVVLWGFGLFYGDRTKGGLYLSRFRLSPLFSASPDAPVGVWTPSHLPPFTDPADENEWVRSCALLVAALRWISTYESWVIRKMGRSYRQGCLAHWPRVVCKADAGPAVWLRLAQRCGTTAHRALDPDR